MTTIYGIMALLLASGVLTWLTKPTNEAPAPSKRREKNRNRLAAHMEPYLNENNIVGLRPRHDRFVESQEEPQSHGTPES